MIHAHPKNMFESFLLCVNIYIYMTRLCELSEPSVCSRRDVWLMTTYTNFFFSSPFPPPLKTTNFDANKLAELSFYELRIIKVISVSAAHLFALWRQREIVEVMNKLWQFMWQTSCGLANSEMWLNGRMSSAICFDDDKQSEHSEMLSKVPL